MGRLHLMFWLVIGQCSISFGQSQTDSAAFHYYKFLATHQIEVGLKLIKLQNHLAEYTLMAEQSDSFKLNREQFDTLTTLFYETSTTLSNAISGIIELREVDSTIGLKEPVLFLFRGYAKALAEYLPVFISLLQNKDKIYTSDQLLTINKTHKRYNLLMKDLDGHTEVIEIASSEFLAKYNLTEYDVLKDGW